MRLQQKYFTGYSQEGFFDPLKNAFTKVKDKFSLNLDLKKTKPDALEKEMLKTYLNDDWLHRRKWVSPQSKIMLQHGTLIKVPAGKEKILSDISSVYEETKNFAKFFNQQFAHEREFFLWMYNEGWRKTLRNASVFNRNLRQSYGEQHIPKFVTKSKYIPSETVLVDPVLDNEAFKNQAIEILNLVKVIYPASIHLQDSSFIEGVLYEWDEEVYELVKKGLTSDFTEEVEVFDQYTNTRIIESRLVHHEEYALILNCMSRFDQFVSAVRDQLNDRLHMPAYTNAIQLRDTLYLQLRKSFTG